jgi:hypothetical protein
MLRATDPDRKTFTLFVALAALAGTCFFFWEYLPWAKRVHLWSDISWYHFPLQAYAFASLKAGRFPAWDPTIYCGLPFAANLQTALFYPPTWLLFALSWPGERLSFKAYEAFTLLHVWLAFLLAWRWLRGRVAPMPAALGALVFACGGFLIYELLHPGVVCATVWLPLGFLAIDQSAERRDWRPLWKLAAASALAFLAGYPSCWLADCILWGIYALTGRATLRTAIGATAAMAASVALCAVQLLPAMEAASFMVPEPKYGASPWTWKTLLTANVFPNFLDFNPGHPGNYEPGCVYFYVGLPALAGVVALLWRRGWRAVAQPAICLAAVFFLSNPPGALVRFVEQFPTADGVLSTFHFYGGVTPMVALIAALGLNAFLAISRKEPLSPVAVWGVAAVASVWTIYQLVLWRRGGQFPTGTGTIESTAVALAIFSAALWVFRGATGRTRVWMGALLLLTAVADYKVYGAGRWFNAVPGDVDKEHVRHGIRGLNQEVYEVLLANRTYRVFLDEGAAPQPTDLRFWGLTTPQGFDPFLPIPYRDTVQRYIPFRTNRTFFPDLHRPELFHAFGVRYVFTHEGSGMEPFMAKSSDFRRILGPDESFYRVYELVGATAPYRWADGKGEARVTEWTPERRDLEVKSDQGGRFELVEQFYPGWRATVDGRPTAIERRDGAFQAILVPAGAHRVSFSYRSTYLRTGAILSGIALTALAVVAWSERRSKRPQPI